MKKISQIEYYAASGPVSPEFQWQEKITISGDGVVFIRSANDLNTLINPGTWIVPVERKKIVKLFAELEAVDTSTIKRVEFEEPIDGGGYASYTISYGNNKIFSISNDTAGETENSGLITDLVQTFINQLDFPEDAIMRELLED